MNRRFSALAAFLTLASLLAPAAAAAKSIDTTKAYRGTGWGDTVKVGFDKDAAHDPLPLRRAPQSRAAAGVRGAEPGRRRPERDQLAHRELGQRDQGAKYDFEHTTGPKKAKEKTMIETGPSA